MAVQLTRQPLRNAVTRHLIAAQPRHGGWLEVAAANGGGQAHPDVRIVDWSAVDDGSGIAIGHTAVDVDGPVPRPRAAADGVVPVAGAFGGPCGLVLVLDELPGEADVSALLPALLPGGDRALVAAAGPLEEIARAVEAVALGGCWVAPTVQEWLTGRADPVPPRADTPGAETGPHAVLTPREQEVHHLVVTGLSNRDIAARLQVSVYTVRTHVRAILRKTGCANRHALTVRTLS